MASQGTVKLGQDSGQTEPTKDNVAAAERISRAARRRGIELSGGRVRRTSSRFCLGVEHGDYNGTELFGVGTDRFIWLGYRVNDDDRVRVFSENFPDDGVIEFSLGEAPEPQSPGIAHSWGRFVYGVDYVLRRNGIVLKRGIDGVVYGNIPGGGMSRSASLTLNLMLSLLEANGVEIDDPFKIVEMAQAVENVYIGSPCGQLDQIMILFAREGMGTHYVPATQSISYVPLGAGASDFRLVVLDTGTERPGLEKSTYKVRRSQCERFAAMLQEDGVIGNCLAEVREAGVYQEIMRRYGSAEPELCRRLKYVYHAQQRFYEMLEAWKAGDIEKVGALFRADGISLRDDYEISGPQLEAMCDIARTVGGVLGERMLGGGDKGASGAIVRAEAVGALQEAVDRDYPRECPEYAERYACHVCRTVGGVAVLDGLL